MDPAERARGHHFVNEAFVETEKIFGSLKVIAPAGSPLRRIADEFRDVAESYYEQAKELRKQGDMPRFVTSIACARAWIDAGVKLGAFDQVAVAPFAQIRRNSV